MKNIKRLSELIREKNESIKSKVKENPGSIMMLTGAFFTYSSGLYWGGSPGLG